MLGNYGVAFNALVVKECTRFLRIWVQTLVPPAITMTLYFVIFGQLIGSRVGELEGFAYVEFIMPGLVMLAIINNSYSNVASSFFSAKFQRNVEELLVAPVPNVVIILGFIAGGMLRAMLVGLIVSIVALSFVDLQIHNYFIVVVTAILTAMLFALGGLLNAIFAKTFDDISIIPTFILAPLTYLGGVFYSLSMLPEIGQQVSQFNPILYMVNAFRYGFIGYSDVSLTIAFSVLVGSVIVLFSLAYYLLGKGFGIRS
ncbi:ABC transporter permease [Saccharobesus litoralis]|uniref:Transport permease protein n=1 Tax=Saccharobesus litoralis TaxID=2172099 RepID=A0A2S0VT51_9ALTE|nr:ABC transporter permease [Saccharobesus litoralis]AWB67270.1 ABC transporter permease [Saccharobesus litoralis]